MEEKTERYYDDKMVTCLECKKKNSFGIWIESKFKENPILIFCSEKCKNDYLKRKIDKIKTEYPKYYNKILEDFEKKKIKENSADFLHYAEKYVV